MYDYNNFIVSLRKEELKKVTIELNSDIIPKLKWFITVLNTVELKDGVFHIFYDEIKNIIVKFVTFWEDAIDEVIKLKDYYCNNINKEILIELITNSIRITEKKQKDFVKEHARKEVKINDKYELYVKRLKEMRESVVKFDRPQHAVDFVNEHLGNTIVKTYALLDLTHTAIGLKLSELLYQLKMSIEDNISRIKTNIRVLKEEDELAKKKLNKELCDAYKDFVSVNRKKGSNVIEWAEVNKSLNKISKKWENNNKNTIAVNILESELNCWKNRFNDLNTIECNLSVLKQEISDTGKEICIYKSSKCMERPGPKQSCWDNIETSYSKHVKYLQKSTNQTVNSLVTHFCVRGFDAAQHSDRYGTFFIDNFGHKNYIQKDNQIKKESTEKKYIDKFGRYFINSDGVKIYELADWCSNYKVGKDSTFVKVQPDVTKKAVTDNRESNNVITSAEGTIDKETAEYLKGFSGILSKTLYDVAITESPEPIHCFAHKLLANKYRGVDQESTQWQLDAETHHTRRCNLLKEKTSAKAEMWRAKQIKRCLPEDCDDTDIQRQEYLTMQNDFNYDLL